MRATTIKTGAGQAAEALAKADEAYRRAWAEERRAAALDALRCSLPGLERAVERRKREIAELEAWLAQLTKMRSDFATEFASLPEDTSRMPGWEEDRVRRRRRDLLEAVAALDGNDPRGTLVDSLAVEGKPRIPGTRRRIEDAQGQLTKAAAELEVARRQLA